MPERLFVYGTLMRGSSHPMARALEAHANCLGEARYNGRLYLVESYPGVVESPDPGDVVFGDVFALREAGILDKLDEYEGCGPDAAQPAEYRRQVEHVTLADGSSVEAWVYIYNWPVETLTRIASGRFGAAET